MFSISILTIQLLFFIFSAGLFQSVLANKMLMQDRNNGASINPENMHKAEPLLLNKGEIPRAGVTFPQAILTPDDIRKKNCRDIIANYLQTLENIFHIPFESRFFAYQSSEKATVTAENFDYLFSHTGLRKESNHQILHSQSTGTNYPVLVVDQDKVMQPLHSKKPVRIAIVNNYPLTSLIREYFPSAIIVSYPSLYSAMLSVYKGKNDYLVGDSQDVGLSIENDFNHALKIIKFWPENQQEYYSLEAVNNEKMIREVDAERLDVSVDDSLINNEQSIKSNYLLSLNKTLLLTEQEKEWIARNNTVSVLINPYYMPFTMLDENGDIRGIVGDILDLITLQTGLKFEALSENSNRKMAEIIKKGHWGLLPAITYTDEREELMDFSKPFLSSPLVAVVKNELNALTALDEEIKIAVPVGSASVEWLKQNYPAASLTLVDNSSIAIAMLDEGKVDAAVSNQLTASYMISHYYPGILNYFPLPTRAPVQIGFGVPKDNKILLSVINKALNHIPKSEITRLTHEWAEMPNVKIDTWELYRKPFYYVVALSTVLILSTLFWGGYLLREIRQRKRTQDDLEYQLNFRNTLSDAIPMPLYLVSMQGGILSCNNAFSLFFSHQRMDFFSDSLSDIDHPLHEIYRFLIQNIDSSVKEKSVHLHQIELFNGIEKRSLLHWSTFCIMPSNKDPLIICGWQDITDSVCLMSALQREKDQAIDATRAKSIFLSRMSHEIRTPVSAVIGFLELLATQKRSPEETEKAIQLAYDTSRSLLSLIGDVLDMEKIESGHYHLAPKWVSLPEIVQDVLMMFDALAKQKKITLRHTDEIDSLTVLWLDPQAIKQILTNLVSNALKFIHYGYIEIQTSLVKKNDRHGLLSIRVVDTGVGISVEDQKKLFRPFSQANEGRLQTGSGLGLVICRELLSFMQGDITISSQPNQGTTFIISIPLKTAHGPMDKEITVVDDLVLPDALSILIADDHKVNRMLLRSQLSSLGYQIDEASNGLEALALIKSSDYDLLITDLNMPEMDGISLTSTVREFNSRLIIWGLTANAQHEDREAGLASGMNLCLFKPLNLTELKRNLASLKHCEKADSHQDAMNIALFQEQMMHNTELVRKMLILAQQENRRDLNSARQACQTADRSMLNKALHRMKGAVQILGAPRLHSLIQNLEWQNGQDSSFSSINKELDQIEVEILFLELFISDYLNKKKAS